MTQEQFENLTLTLMVGTVALGGVILVSLLGKGRKRYVFAGLFGLIAAILLQPVMLSTMAVPAEGAAWLLTIAICVWLALLAVAGVEGLTAGRLKDIGEGAPLKLIPENWPGMRRFEATTPRDQVRRWFVTVAAATGAVVGSVFGLGMFWDTLLEALHPRPLLFGFVLVCVSMFLIGPVQGYVLEVGAGAAEPSDPSRKLHDMFARGMDGRTLGRFALVLVAYVQLYLLSSCVGAAVKHGDARVVYIIVNAAVTPAIVSYYWSAALQRGAASVRDAALEPSIYVGAIMFYGMALVMVVSLAFSLIEPGGGPDNRSVAIMFVFSPVIAIVPAVAIGAMVTGVYAFSGGWAIDRFPGRQGMLALLGGLVAASVLYLAMLKAYIWLVADQPIELTYGTFVGGILGWFAGLWASGFPRLLTQGHAPLPADVTPGA